MQRYLKTILLIGSILMITSCNDGASANTGSTVSQPIVTKLPNSGGATVTIPTNTLNLNTDTKETSVGIHMDGGTNGLAVVVTATAVSSSNNAIESNISVTAKPSTLVAGTTPDTSLFIDINEKVPSGNYNVELLATYESQEQSLGTIGLTINNTSTPSNGTPISGKLSISSADTTIFSGTTKSILLSLDGSNKVQNLVVDISSSNTANITVSPSQCILSTESNICSLTITGIESGNSTISATSSSSTATIDFSDLPGWVLVGGDVVPNAYWLHAITTVGNSIYVGGKSILGSTFESYGAMWSWDGESWNEISQPGTPYIQALTNYNNTIYAGGINGSSDYNYVYSIGIGATTWSSLGSPDSLIYSLGTSSLSVSNTGDLYATTEYGVFKYESSVWRLIGNESNIINGSLFFSSVFANSQLYVGGGIIGDKGAAVWSYNGTSWSIVGGNALPNSAGDTIALAIDKNNSSLYAGGYESNGHAAVWQLSGNQWIQLGESGIPNSSHNIYSIVTDSNTGYIYAAGTSTGDLGTVWMWNGSEWSTVGGDNIPNCSGTGIANPLTSIIMKDGKLYAAGNYKGYQAALWVLQ